MSAGRCQQEDVSRKMSAGRCQQEDVSRKMSAGRHWRSGMSEGNSFRGAKADYWAAEKIASRIGLWRKILSPLLGCVNYSPILLHYLFRISPQRKEIPLHNIIIVLYFAALIIITSNKFFSVLAEVAWYHS